MNTQEILERACNHLTGLSGHIFDVLTVTKPVSPEAAVNLAKVISKLSPLVGNMIEFNAVEVLNDQEEFEPFGKWIRQDPGFPDTIFLGDVNPTPGLEIKAWFPLATEITARFRDSQNHFFEENTYVALLAWLPEHLIWGRPRILSVCYVPSLSVARARDNHYHNPPDYIVLEPEDTSERTGNLQQTNTAGFKWQGTAEEFTEAEQIVAGWGPKGKVYLSTREYQARLKQLSARFRYRNDTNYAKLDRIVHPQIEAFKAQIYGTEVHGLTVAEWNRLLNSGNEQAIRTALEMRMGVKEEDTDELLP